MAQVELVRTTTSDGVRLDGVLWPVRRLSNESSSAAEVTGAPEAVICLHGVGGNFYGSTLFDALTTTLCERGVAVLRVNTRGHDGVSTASTTQGGLLQGAAYERVDDCRLDIQAWVDFLERRQLRRVGLVGHSLGAIKALYAQARQPQPQILAVVAISPPRLAYSCFQREADASSFRASLQTARHWIEQGQPDMLFRATFPFPLILSAATFLDKYGPEERYDFLRFAPEVRCPVSFIFGEMELAGGSSAFQDLPNLIRAVDWPGTAPRIREIPHANHFYAGCLPSLNQAILELLT